MTIVYVVAIAVAVFYAGKRYGASVEKAAVSAALAAFTEAKSLLVEGVAKAKAEAAAEVTRLEALAKKYL